MTFKTDLSKGKIAEKAYVDRLRKKGHKHIFLPASDSPAPLDIIFMCEKGIVTTIEIKTDFYHEEDKSNNIAIEYSFNGKPSGISSSQAHKWSYYLKGEFWSCDADCIRRWLLANEFKRVHGGDNGLSKFFLVPQEEFKKQFKKLT